MKIRRIVLLLTLFTGIAVSFYKVKARQAERTKLAEKHATITDMQLNAAK